MACAVATPVLEPSGDFPAWLEAQGVNAEVAQAMDSELGIRDYGVLRACVRDGLVRAELLSTARDRLPFGFYAVLRQVVKALQGAEPHDAGTPCWDAAAAAATDSTFSPGDVTLRGLVDVLLALFNGLSRELQMSVQRLDDMEHQKHAVASPLSATAATSEDATAQMHSCIASDEAETISAAIKEESEPKLTASLRKAELFQDAVADLNQSLLLPQVQKQGSVDHSANESLGKPHLDIHPKFIIQNVTSLSNSKPNPTDAHPCLWPMQEASRTLNEDTENGCLSINHSQMPSGEGTSYELKSAIPNHLETPRLETSQDKPHSCDVCDRSFTWPSELTIHQHEHAGEQLHHCRVCGRRFLKSSYLKVHSRTHTGEKPYCCQFCGHRFSRYGVLKSHLLTHTGEKPYTCKVCGRKFTQRSNMRSHERTQHGTGGS
uniref:Zinc finger protein 24-like n=1 Tax=Petromyzon marinus TaxID=7757 RepID=A0AAJ7WV21_PETMA|nr:zinc finger protein 24-like [Petromyzon marinus]